MKGSTFSTTDVVKIAKLAKIPLTTEQTEELIHQVGITVSYVSDLQSLPTEGVVETSQVTGMENIFREDVIDTFRILSQEDALSQSKRTYNGFFVIDQVLEG